MNTDRIRLGILFGTVFLIALLLKLPAAWVLHWAGESIPSGWRWTGVSGTALNAIIENPVYEFPAGKSAAFDRVRLKIPLPPLLLGRLHIRYRFTSGEGDLDGRLYLAPQHWRIIDADGDLPLRFLYGPVPELELYGLNGRMRPRVESFSGTYTGLLRAGRLELLRADAALDLAAGTFSLSGQARLTDAAPAGLRELLPLPDGGRGDSANLDWRLEL